MAAGWSARSAGHERLVPGQRRVREHQRLQPVLCLGQRILRRRDGLLEVGHLGLCLDDVDRGERACAGLAFVARDLALRLRERRASAPRGCGRRTPGPSRPARRASTGPSRSGSAARRSGRRPCARAGSAGARRRSSGRGTGAGRSSRRATTETAGSGATTLLLVSSRDEVKSAVKRPPGPRRAAVEIEPADELVLLRAARWCRRRSSTCSAWSTR